MGRITKTDISMAINILSHPQSGDDSDIRKAVADAIEAMRELQRYKDLEEQGRLIELPCKTGDTVWLIPFIGGNPLGTIEEDQVTMVGITSKSTHVKTRRFSSYNTTYIIGKRAFLTKEEAEAKLKELKGMD